MAKAVVAYREYVNGRQNGQREEQQGDHEGMAGIRRIMTTSI